MRSREERIALLHARAEQLQNKKDRQERILLGTVTAVLTVICCFLVAGLGGISHAVKSSGAYGASLLSENAGGYVFTALFAFMLGVAITVFCIKMKNNRADNNRNIPVSRDDERGF